MRKILMVIMITAALFTGCGEDKNSIEYNKYIQGTFVSQREDRHGKTSDFYIVIKMDNSQEVELQSDYSIYKSVKKLSAVNSAISDKKPLRLNIIFNASVETPTIKDIAVDNSK